MPPADQGELRFPWRSTVAVLMCAACAFSMWRRWQPWVVDTRTPLPALAPRHVHYQYAAFLPGVSMAVLFPGRESSVGEEGALEPYGYLTVVDCGTGNVVRSLDNTVAFARTLAGSSSLRLVLRVDVPDETTRLELIDLRTGGSCGPGVPGAPGAAVPIPPDVGLPYRAACVSPDGRKAVVSFGREAQIWRLDGHGSACALRSNERGRWPTPYALDPYPDGYEHHEGDVLRAFKQEDGSGWWFVVYDAGHNDPITDVTFTRDGRHVVTVGHDGEAMVWDAQSGACVTALAGHTDTIVSVDAATDGRILTASLDRSLRVWDATTGEQLHVFARPSVPSAAVFSPDGETILAVPDLDPHRPSRTRPTRIGVLNARTGEVMFELSSEWCDGAGFSPDGDRIITVGMSFLSVVDAQTGRYLAALSADRGYSNGDIRRRGLRPDIVSSFCSRDGTRVLTPSWQRNELWVWRRVRDERWWAFPELTLLPVLAVLAAMGLWHDLRR